MRQACWVFGVLLFACARQRTQVRAPEPAQVCSTSPELAFVDVSRVDLEGGVVPHLVLRVCGAQGTSWVPLAQFQPAPNTQVVEAHRGEHVLPGLGDMHAHVVRPSDLVLYLMKGVTTVRNMWGAPIHLDWRKAGMLGPHILTTGPIVDGDPPAHDGSLVVRNETQAVEAVKLHQRFGYDFIKVYGGLSLPAYDALMAAAKQAGIPVVGHVPRAVGLLHAVESGQRTVEHLDGFVEALQSQDSPVKGKWNRAARAQKIDFVDEAKLPALVATMKEHHIFNVPTRVVKDQDQTAAVVRTLMQRPAARYMPAGELAIWEPAPDPPAGELDRAVRTLALYDRIIAALHAAGAGLWVGTDTGNPLVVPGFSVHEELAHWVRLGMTPVQALRGAAGGNGYIFVKGNPTENIENASHVTAVLLDGRYHTAAQLEQEWNAATARDDGLGKEWPGLEVPQGARFHARFNITWKGVPFGSEELAVTRGANGQGVVDARAYDPHKGQAVTMHLAGRRLDVHSDGAAGRGEAHWETGVLHGTSLPGVAFERTQQVSDSAALGAHGMLATRALWGPPLLALRRGDSLPLESGQLALGSSVEMLMSRVTATRGEGSTFTVDDGKERSVLTLDDAGWPLTWEFTVYGGVVRYARAR